MSHHIDSSHSDACHVGPTDEKSNHPSIEVIHKAAGKQKGNVGKNKNKPDIGLLFSKVIRNVSLTQGSHQPSDEQQTLNVATPHKPYPMPSHL